MKLERFGEFKTGSIEPIETSRGTADWAFVPNSLMPNWEIPTELWPLIVKARDRIGRLNGVGQTLPDPFLLLRPLQRREALRSSSLEGTYISPKELLLFEIDKHRRENKSDRATEWREVYNYYLALQKGRARIKSVSLDNNLIRLLHKILMRGTRGEEKSPGEFRDCQVHVGDERRFNPPPVAFLADGLANLEANYLAPTDDFDPLVKAFILHYQFEAIHPFKDGNGRIGRLILSLMIFDWLDLSEPWVYLSEFFENHRDQYIDKMFRVSTNGEWTEWIRFCLEGTVEQAEFAIRRCDKLRTIKEDYLKRVGTANSRMHAIINDLFSTPIIVVSDLQQKFGTTYPTARSDIAKLIEAEVLSPIENTHPQAFAATAVWNVAFGEQ